MEWHVAAMVMVAILIVQLLLGIPIGISLWVTAGALLLTVLGPQQSLTVMTTVISEFWSGYEILALTLFIFMGEFLLVSGMSDDLFDIADKWLGRLPGGLSVVTIGASALFGTLSGSGLAAIATMGRLAIPKMLRKNYSKALAAGSVTCGGTLAAVIPPSTIAVLYAVLVGVSAAKQLMAGLMPGLLLAALFITTCVLWATVKPDAAPREPTAPWKTRLVVLKGIIPALVIVVLTLGSMYLGITTVTESAAVGALASAVLAFTKSRKTLSVRAIVHSTTRVVEVTAFIALLAVGGKLLSWTLSYYRIPQHLLEILPAILNNRWSFLIVTQIIFIILGMFLDGIGMLYISVPILAPMLVGFNIDLIWFGVMFIINVQLGAITPPVGMGVYTLQGVVGDQIGLSTILKGCLPFCLVMVAAIALIMFFPAIALWIPGNM